MRTRHRVLIRGNGLLLRLYPAAYRDEFGEEMADVFDQALVEASDQGRAAVIRLCLRELGGWLSSVGRQWSSTVRAGPPGEKGEAMGDERQPHLQTPETWGQACLGAAPLLISGLTITLGPFLAFQPWGHVLLLGSYLLILAGLVAAWVRGFPRWSYSYAGYAVLFALFLSAVSTPGLVLFGHTFGQNDPWAWRAWLPLAAALLLGSVLTRSLRPALRFVQGAWQDWTRVSFALYAALPMLLLVVFDEVHPPWPAFFLAAGTLCLVLGALAYVRCVTATGRALSLLAGLGTSWLIVTAGVAAYWHDMKISPLAQPMDWTDNAVPMTIALGVLAVLMMAPVLLGLVRRGVGRQFS